MDEQRAAQQYLPRAVLARAGSETAWWQETGGLLFSDVSGFTALSEKLARHGRAGTEEMVTAISTVFTPLLDEIAALGGDVLKFGGDALLTWFPGEDGVLRAASCAHRLRLRLRTAGIVRTPYGQVRLGMSQGLHAGEVTFFLVGDRHRELLVTGPPVTETLACEAAAARGEVLLSHEAARRLPARLLGTEAATGVLLRSASSPPAPGTVVTVGEDLSRYVPTTLRGRLATVVSDSEHRTATVAFLQYLGCDALLATEGPAALHTALHALLDRVVAEAERYGVTLICTDVGPDGGKLMLATGAPDADEHDAEAMLRFGLAVLGERSMLPLRMGVNRGAVYGGLVGSPDRWTYSTMGDPVNLAARVMGKAAPGTVLATGAVLRAAGGHVRATPVPAFTVKGKALPVDAAVVTDVGARGGAVPSSPLVGRDVELQQLTGLLDAARAGRGRVVELVGDAGTGKSRLAKELADRADGFLVLSAAGERYHRASAYFAAHLLVRAALDIDVAASPEAAGQLLAERVTDAAPELLDWLPLFAVAARAEVPMTSRVEAIAPEFRAQRTAFVVSALLARVLDRPTLLLLEDAFWFDDASSALLAEVLARSPRQPWMACLTRREEPTGLHAGLGYPSTTLRLSPLPQDAALALVRSTAAGAELPLASARRLAEGSAGNPFFLLQMVSEPGGSDLPQDVEAVVAARLDRLPFAARRLLRQAAVLGAYVDRTLLGRLVDAPPDDATWRELDDYLEPAGGGLVRFRHDLFRQVAYDALPFRRRRELHLRAGLAIEVLGHLGPRSALLSLHFEAAGDRMRTWRYAVQAADMARASAANAEAAKLYERALGAARGLPHLDPAAVSTVAEAYGDVAELLGRYAEATQGYQLARRTSPSGLSDPRLLRKEGVLRERQGRYREALRWYGRGLRLPSVDAGTRAALLVGVAAARYRQGRFRASAEAALAAAELAETSGARSELAHAYYLVDAALTDLGDVDAVLYRQLALPIYEELGDLLGQADVLNNTGIDAYYEGRREDAIELYTASRTLREQAGDVVGAATADNNIAEVLSDLGRFEQAQPLFEEALRVWRHAAYTVGVALASSNLARTHLRCGRTELVEPLLDDAERLFTTIRADMLLLETRVRRLELLVVQERTGEAVTLAEQLERLTAELRPSPVVTATLARAKGTLLLQSGAVDEGTRLLVDALLAFDEAGMTWDAEATRNQLVQAALADRVVDLDTGTRASAPVALPS